MAASRPQLEIARRACRSRAAARAARLAPLGVLALLAVTWAAACGPSERELERRMASVRAELAETLQGQDLPAAARQELEGSRGWRALQELYGGEAPETVWVDGEGPRERVDELIDLLGGGDEDEAEQAEEPVEADAYEVRELLELRDRARRAVEEETPDLGRRLADLELAASYAFLTRAFHAIEGRVDPRRLSVGWHMEGREAEPLALLARVRDGAAPSEVLAGLEPSHDGFRRLLEARERYRAVVEAGGWPRIPAEGEALEEGARGPRVAALRKRLALEGDLAGDEADAAPVFDAELADAVRRFQERHGLDADGVVGSGTLEALNVPAEARLRTIALNLERWRWMPATLGDHYLVVNIPEYRLRVVRGGETELAMNVIVGERMNQTPVFSDTMSHLIFNPAWNIPESIAEAEVVPKLVSNPGYAAREGIEVVSPAGERMPPGSILGRRVRREDPGGEGEAAGREDSEGERRGFFARLFGIEEDGGRAGEADVEVEYVTSLPEGYRLRQAPGPRNPLGQVKFMFPNEHNIYLHDTPAGHLFESSERGFSHGCIRVERPFALAEYVLRGNSEWTPDRMRRAVASDEEIEVPLPRELPVHLTYFTAWAGSDGRVHFRPDLYGHDERLAEALAAEEPVSLDLPRLRGEPAAAAG